jgi:hypothetical protein
VIVTFTGSASRQEFSICASRITLFSSNEHEANCFKHVDKNAALVSVINFRRMAAKSGCPEALIFLDSGSR